jgi:UDP-3-O-[3-hydroxymyristoyl] glucosamine N-acyltransferase
MGEGLRTSRNDKEGYFQVKLKELALMVGGELKGEPDIDIKGAAGISDVREGEITFLSDKKLMRRCVRSKASCVIVGGFYPEVDKPQIVVKNPYYAFAKVLEHYYVRPLQPVGISGEAFISGRARIGKDVSIYPFAYISDNAVIGEKTTIYPGVFVGNDTVIGSECILYPNVTIREKVTVGNRVIIHPGSVIGSDGFGYVLEGGRHYKIPQVGGVIIGDNVEIGGNVVIERATTGNTTIGKGTKICDLVVVGHNTKIGGNSILVGQVGVGGSVEIGNYVVIGGQVGIADHTKIDDGCMIAAQSGIMGHITKGVYSGSPAINHKDWLRAVSVFAKLPELARRVKELEKKINLIERGRSE